MRNLLIITLFLTCSQFVLAQERISNLPIEGEYMEVRFIPLKGTVYRLSPEDPFAKTGLFNRKLKPYFKENSESFYYHKRYRRSLLGIAGSATIASISSVAVMEGAFSNDANLVRIGGASMIVGLGLTFWTSYRNSRSVYQAVDRYNLYKNPNLKDVNYLEVVPHPIIMWQFRTSPMDNYEYIGLYGNKLKSYLKQDEDAYRAFKQYKAGHITYSVGNLTMLTGAGMMYYSLLNGNDNLRFNGLSTVFSGAILAIVGNKVMNKNIYKAMHLINFHDGNENRSQMSRIFVKKIFKCL